MRKIILLVLLCFCVTGCGKEEVVSDNYGYTGYEVLMSDKTLDVVYDDKTFCITPLKDSFAEFVDEGTCSFNYVTTEKDTVKYVVDVYTKKEFKDISDSFWLEDFDNTKKVMVKVPWITNPCSIIYSSYKDYKLPVSFIAFTELNGNNVVVTATLESKNIWKDIFRDYDKIDKDTILSTCMYYEKNANCIIDTLVMIMDNIRIGE